MSFHSESFRLFRKRVPCNLLSPKAMTCRLNRTILGILNRDELDALLAAWNKNSDVEWRATLDTIESRLKAEQLI